MCKGFWTFRLSNVKKEDLNILKHEYDLNLNRIFQAQMAHLNPVAVDFNGGKVFDLGLGLVQASVIKHRL